MKFLFFIPLLSSLSVLGQTSTIELDSSITLTAKIIEFDKSEHSIDTCDTGLGWKSICLINGAPWFGSDAGMDLPKNKLSNLTLRIAEKKIELDISGMFNPSFSGILSANQFKIRKDELGYHLYGHFSDGAGSYMCLWKIVKQSSIRLKISNEDRDYSWRNME